jgi:hypothetical protein
MIDVIGDLHHVLLRLAEAVERFRRWTRACLTIGLSRW